MILKEAVSNDEITKGIYNVGFLNIKSDMDLPDETQFDVNNFDELKECWDLFRKENGLPEDCVEYVEEGKEWRPNGHKGDYNDIYIFVPGAKEIVHVSEGTGDNLLKEDRANGYVDYINYMRYALDDGVSEYDGGLLMLTELFREKYDCTEDCVKELLEEMYDDPYTKYQLLMYEK